MEGQKDVEMFIYIWIEEIDIVQVNFDLVRCLLNSEKISVIYIELNR